MSYEDAYNDGDFPRSLPEWWKVGDLVWDWDWLVYHRERPRKMRRGDTYVFDIQIFAPPPFPGPGCASRDNACGPPQNITGWFLWFTVKNNYADPDVAAIVQATTGNGLIQITNATAGLAQVTMPASATAPFPDSPVKMLYDVQGKDTASRISTLESGVLIVFPDVTRALT